MHPRPSSTASGKRLRTASLAPSDSDDDPTTIYDPDQPITERRRLQRQLRDLNLQLSENDSFLKEGNTGLLTVLEESNAINRAIRQTTEAAIDSKLQVTVADLLHRKTVSLMQGSTVDGIDVDDFISKVREFMRKGEDAGRPGWVQLGQFAALPASGRAATAGFLLGPLHAEKKARKVAKRSAPLQTNRMVETRPEVLNMEDLASLDNDLTVICAQVLRTLSETQAEIQDRLEELISEEAGEEENIRLMHSMGLRATGGVDLMRFVVNPKSFAQTVENIFYLSFLIRDGKVGVEFDDDGIPSVAPVEAEDYGARTGADARHQVIFTLDEGTWADIVEVLGIEEGMIRHREVETRAPGATEWYS